MDKSEYISFQNDINAKKWRPTYTQIIVFGYFIIILVGAALLTLPISSKSGNWTNYFDSLFTSTSATCVTGLILFDTYTHWSIFGQIILLILIQIGGLGFMTMITTVSVFTGRRVSLHERKLLMQSAGNTKLSGMILLVKQILFGTLIFEGIGAVILTTRFCPEFGLVRGIYYSIFHSVSAFCNAGFDLMGIIEPNSSLTYFQNDPVINITISALIVIGGLGFMVWNDIMKRKFDIDHYSLHTKIVLSTTVILIVSATVLFFIFERHGNFSSLSMPEKWIHSFFQAVTPRTAGFNTTDLSTLSESGTLLTIVLMLIGGSSGSTAGGIKTTTFIVIFLTAVASSRRNRYVNIFKKRLSEQTLNQASAIATIYLTAVIISTMFMCAFEPFSFTNILFEVSSAIGTVGLTTGITSMLTPASHMILIFLMFAGRVGGLTLMLVLAEKRDQVSIKRPHENILIG